METKHYIYIFCCIFLDEIQIGGYWVTAQYVPYTETYPATQYGKRNAPHVNYIKLVL